MHFIQEIEKQFITEVAETFEKFLESKDRSPLLNIPKCRAYHIDGENDFIVLQNVTLLGYTPMDKKNIVNYEQCKHVIKSMARFHSVSLAFKNENKEKFNHLTSLLTETFYTVSHYENWYKEFHVSII